MTKQVTEADLRALTDANADPVDREAALRHLAHWEKGKYDHLEPAIAALLRDHTAVVRGAAVKAIVGSWHRAAYVAAAAAMLQGDADWSVRADAAFALGSFARFTGQQRDEILRALAQAVRQDDDGSVQAASYEQVLALLGRAVTWEPDAFDQGRDVDWALLEPYLA